VSFVAYKVELGQILSEYFMMWYLVKHRNNFTFTIILLVQVEVFWVVTPCRIVVGHQRFRGLPCLHLQGEVNVTGKRA